MSSQKSSLIHWLSCLSCLIVLSSCAVSVNERSGTDTITLPTSAAAQLEPSPSTASSSEVSQVEPSPTSIANRNRLSGTGYLRAVRNVDLSFLVAGRVSEVYVSEGDVVTKGQLLAILDPRPFDTAILQAQADLRAAYAAQSALNEAPNSADVQAANANVQLAQIGVAQAQHLTEQNTRQAEALLHQAEQNLETVRNTLSAAKTEAELQMHQASGLLIQAQAAYSQARSDWEYVQETGKVPINPPINVEVSVDIPTVGDVDVGNLRNTERKATDSERNAYYNAFVAAEAAMFNAERGVQQAEVAYELARQNEITGIAQAEQQVALAQSELIKVQGPPDQDAVAAAQRNLAIAQAARQRLNPAPRESSQEIAAANIARAEAAVQQAQLSREYAELRAPFDGTVARLNLQEGAVTGPLPLNTSGGILPEPAIQLIDMSELEFEVDINEADIGRISLNQRTEIVFDALPNQTFTGRVRYISPSAQQTGAIRSYTVRIKLDSQEGLREGMGGHISLLSAP